MVSEKEGLLALRDVTLHEKVSPCVEDANGDILDSRVASSNNSRRL
jgi:hypothetical protein